MRGKLRFMNGEGKFMKPEVKELIVVLGVGLQRG